VVGGAAFATPGNSSSPGIIDTAAIGTATMSLRRINAPPLVVINKRGTGFSHCSGAPDAIMNLLSGVAEYAEMNSL
jgi:hypothetical protein